MNYNPSIKKSKYFKVLKNTKFLNIHTLFERAKRIWKKRTETKIFKSTEKRFLVKPSQEISSLDFLKSMISCFTGPVPNYSNPFIAVTNSTVHTTACDWFF